MRPFGIWTSIMLSSLQKTFRKFYGNSATEKLAPNWIVQEDCLDSEYMIEALENTGTPYILINKETSEPIHDENLYNIFRGSLEKSELYINHPKVFLENMWLFDCDVYYNRFVTNLLNEDNIILNAGKVKESKKYIFEQFEGDRLFIRPVAGDKLFTGTTLTKKWFDNEIDIIFDHLSRRPVEDHDKILFSSYKAVENECRVLINYGKIISWSSYSGCKSDLGLIQDCLRNIKIYPEPFFTADICMDSGKIIEINSFSCAGLYDMDLNEVVCSVNDFFTREK